MKFAVIGTGKTGSCILKLLPKQEVLYAFNSQNPPTVAKLKQVDASIVFVTGPVMQSMIPSLLEAKRPLVTGSTNIKWPPHLNEELIQLGIPWIHANNFSIGMNLLFHMSSVVARSLPLFDDSTLHIKEHHHKDKKDTPSGTSLKLQEIMGDAGIKIHSTRQGEHAGEHTLELSTPQETLTLTHQARDRTLYAKGAIWAAQELLWQPSLKGLISFEDLVGSLLLNKKEADKHDQ